MSFRLAVVPILILLAWPPIRTIPRDRLLSRRTPGHHLPHRLAPPTGPRTVTEGSLTPAPNGGQLVYEVTFQGKPLIEASALRLDLKDQPPLGPNVRIVNATTTATDETYQLVAGKASSVRNHFNALRVELEEPAAPGRKLVMEARAYDDAVAFRYVVPEQPALNEFRLAREGTEFRISKDPFIYALVPSQFPAACTRANSSSSRPAVFPTRAASRATSWSAFRC